MYFKLRFDAKMTKFSFSVRGCTHGNQKNCLHFCRFKVNDFKIGTTFLFMFRCEFFLDM